MTTGAPEAGAAEARVTLAEVPVPATEAPAPGGEVLGGSVLGSSVLGRPVTRVEDARLLTGQASYVDNLSLPGAAHVAFVRSPMAHAHVRGVDTSRARSAPGVVAVLTAAELSLGPLPMEPGLPAAMARQTLAADTVRYVGEPVAAVVARTPAQAADAIELVEVDYDPLPAVVEPAQALADTTVLFPEYGTNTAFDLAQLGVDDDFSDGYFDDCEVVVKLSIASQRLAPCPLEVRAAAARWSGGKLTQWASTQVPHRLRDELADLYQLPLEQVRVIAPDVGGGFGGKAANYPEYYVLGALARAAGRPVKWVETRSESMLGLGHGRGQAAEIELGGTRAGRVLAARLSLLQDAGAYPMLGAVLPRITRLMGPGVYELERFAGRAVSVVTNTVPVVSYRGAGRPEATYAIERAMDRFAVEVGLDPAELRRRNYVSADAFPYRTATGLVYDSGDYAQSLDRALDACDYPALRAEQRRRRESGEPVQLGIGICSYVEITNPRRHGDFGAVRIDPAGRAVIRAGTHAHGQGHATVYAMVVAEELGIPVTATELVQGDTDQVDSGKGTFGSRSMQTAGAAVHLAAVRLRDQARQLAAELLGTASDEVELDRATATFVARGRPADSGVGWARLARYAEEQGRTLEASADFDPKEATFPFGTQVAVVEVDTETGEARVRRITAVDDCGRILNPLLLAGQLHGGMAQGIAQVLYEQLVYDEDGNPITATLADYGTPYAPDLPEYELVEMETPTPLNALGAKGAGESGTIGSVPAVANAVIDALATYDVLHLDLPTTPERIWAAAHPDRAEVTDDLPSGTGPDESLAVREDAAAQAAIQPAGRPVIQGAPAGPRPTPRRPGGHPSACERARTGRAREGAGAPRRHQWIVTGVAVAAALGAVALTRWLRGRG